MTEQAAKPLDGRTAVLTGSANGIGFEDLICIEDHEFLESIAAGRKHTPGFDDALRFVSVQDAVFRSWDSGHWEDVRSLRDDGAGGAR